MKRTILWLASTLLLGACELPDAITNGDFDSWCGETPCGWEVDGRVKRVSTWHSHDYAASLESDGARLHQLNTDVNYPCLSFSLLAKVGKGAKAFVELDFFDDGGEADWSRPIPEGDFQPLDFAVRAPEWYSSVRFIVRKEGSGEVVLAQLHASYDTSDRCAGDQVTPKHLPARAPCDDGDECLSGMCETGYCVGCESDDDCSEGQTCGYAAVGPLFDLPFNALPQCVEPHERAVGAICLGDAECETGVCCEGVCSTCCGEVGCDEAGTCRRSTAGDGEASEVLEPHLCSAGLKNGDTGDYCTGDVDCEASCESLACTGLCSPLAIVGSDCAMIACENAQCSSVECTVETVEVGRCR